TQSATRSLPAALPISRWRARASWPHDTAGAPYAQPRDRRYAPLRPAVLAAEGRPLPHQPRVAVGPGLEPVERGRVEVHPVGEVRSEEHTSELQSREKQ